MDQNNHTPVVSVIIPCYNSEKYISECLDSVVSQTLADIEIICVDDGSTDGTDAILQKYSSADPRIKLIRQKNSYAGVARNNGILAAKGKYIAFVDSDDKLSTHYLETMFRAAEKYRVDLVTCPVYIWDGNSSMGRVEVFSADNQIPRGQTFSYKDVSSYIFQCHSGRPSGILCLRHFITENDIYFLKLRHSEDFYFICVSLLLAHAIVYVDECGYYYRKDNLTSLEHTKDIAPLLFYTAFEELKARIIAVGLFQEVKQSYVNRLASTFVYNFGSVYSFSSFSIIFKKLKDISETELEWSIHEKGYFHDTYCYEQLKCILSYETPEDYLFNEVSALKKEKFKRWNELQQLYKEKAERWHELQSLYKEKGERWKELQILYKEKRERWHELQGLYKEKREWQHEIQILHKKNNEYQQRIENLQQQYLLCQTDKERYIAKLHNLTEENSCLYKQLHYIETETISIKLPCKIVAFLKQIKLFGMKLLHK